MRAVITTGEEKFYSNGLDLDCIEKLSEKELTAFHVDLYTIIRRLLLFPTVTVAAINGTHDMLNNFSIE